MALTKVIGAGVQGISNSSDATAMTIGSDEVVDFASNADFIDGRGIRLGAGNDFQLYHDGTDNHINVTGAQTLNVQTSGNNAIVVDANGHVTKPLQPAFLANPSATLEDFATGQTNNVNFAAERFDRNADYNAGGSPSAFTAPVTGVYQLNFHLYILALDTAATYVEFAMVTSNRSYNTIIDPNFSSDLGYYHMTMSVLADMDASDTAKITMYQQGGTAQLDLATNSTFSGYLVA